MRKVEFLDTSLRDGEQTPGVNFSIKEKVSIAKQLEKWGISAIEAGFPAASPDSFTAVKEIAKVLTKTAVTGLARSVKSDIDACYEALKDAKYPQVHVFIATSPIHREFKLNKSKEEILEAIKEHVSYARSKFEVVEFSPEDATRTELDFLLQVVQTAVDAGASYINIPDTVGFTTPEEYGAIFKYLIDHVKTDREIIYSPHCHDDLGMAVANSLAAVKNGARRVEGTINGIGERAGNAALEEVAVALNIREDYYQVESPKFKSLADKKHEITDADIRALVAGTAVENPDGFQFNDLRLSTNADESISAAVSLRNEEGEVLEFLADGQGSVEAIFNAIDKFFNQTVRLTSYNIDAVTDGIDAQARVLVSVENVDTDTIFNASGLDFDVLKASAIAYINANTLVQKENAGEMGRAVSYRDLPQA